MKLHILRVFRALLGVAFCVFPFFFFAFAWFMLHSWLLSRDSHNYYFQYPYVPFAVVLGTLGTMELISIYYAAWRRTPKSILLLLVPPALSVLLIYFVEIMPHTIGSGSDRAYFSHVQYACDDWYAAHRSYPATQGDLKRAIGSSTKYEAELKERGMRVQLDSQYRNQGLPVDYQVAVETNARGPRTNDISPRPGVVYYSVSPNLQEFWITMTALSGDAPGSAVLLKETKSDRRGWVIHGNVGDSSTQR